MALTTDDYIDTEEDIHALTDILLFRIQEIENRLVNVQSILITLLEYLIRSERSEYGDDDDSQD